MKYIKRFFESNLDSTIEKDIQSHLPDCFIINFNSNNSFTITKRLSDEDELIEHRQRITSVTKNKNISDREIEEYINSLTEYFYIYELDDFITYLETKYYLSYDDTNDSIYELEIDIRIKHNTIESITKFINLHLAYLQDEYPFRLNVYYSIGPDSLGFYNCIIKFEDNIDYYSVKDYLIPFIYMVDQELILYNYGNRGTLYIGNSLVNIKDLDNIENFTFNVDGKNFNFLVIE